MTTKNDTKSIPFSDVAKGLNQAFDNADPQRLAGLQNLQRMRTAKDTALRREQTRLNAKLGTDHPRVTALAVKRQANQDFKRDLDLGISRARTPAVKPDANAWTLHGHVRNSARVGLPNLTVGLYDQKNQWIEELGYACTDKNGYFRLSHQGEKAAATTGIVSTRADVSGHATTSGAQIYIHVLSAKGATLYVDPKTLQPAPGQVDYREIILDGEASGCAPPPGSSQPPPGPGQDPGKDKTGRYLGNSSAREIHDLQNVKKNCQIDEIRADHRVYFSTQKEALDAGYDYCAYCFGKGKSKR